MVSLTRHWQRRVWRCAPIVVGLAVALAMVPAAQAGLIIQATFDSSITNDPNASSIENTINQAISQYENTYANPIKVNIYFKEMNSGLGQSNTGVIYNIGYAGFRSGLATNQAISGQSDQATALANLPNQANNPISNDTSLYVKPADARALGFNSDVGVLGSDGIVGHGNYDGIIGLNTSITFPPNGQNNNTFTLLGTTEHEIDEVLGLGSNVGFLNDPAAEDLYRFAGNSSTRSYTTSGDNAWFSIDGGNTDLVQFNQGSQINPATGQPNGGDYGDWWSNNGAFPGASTHRVQDAFQAPNVAPTILNDGGAELTALDVVGYYQSSPLSPSSTPEPCTLLLLGQGVALFGFAWRRSQRTRRDEK